MDSVDMDINPGDQVGPSTSTGHSGRPVEIDHSVFGQAEVPYFGELMGAFPPKRRLTDKRQKLIQDFKGSYSGDQVGSGPWLRQLIVYLKGVDPLIRDADVFRWCTKHSWISQPNRRIPPLATAGTSRRLAPAGSGQGPESIQNSPDNIVTSLEPRLPPRTPEEDPETRRQQEEEARLKKYFDFQLQIKKLKDFAGNDPVLRAQVPVFNSLNRAAARAVLSVMGKTREEFLHNQLETAGIPHVPLGFKTEVLPEVSQAGRTIDLFSSSEDDVVVIQGNGETINLSQIN